MRSARNIQGCSLRYAVILEQILLFDILEVAISTDLQLITGSVIADDDTMLVHLKSRDGPHVVDTTLYSSLKCTALGVTIHQNHYLTGSHNSTYADCQSRLGHFIDITFEETAVCNDGISSQRLLTCTAGQRRTRLIESDMTVGTDTAKEQVDATELLNLLLVGLALSCKILSIAVQNVDIL